MAKREKSIYLIQSVTHSLEVLEELAKEKGELGVTELAKRLKLHKNNIFRLLATLELKGFVEQNSRTEEYRLGTKCGVLGAGYSTGSTIVGKLRPVLEEVCAKLDETVSIALPIGNSIYYAASFPSARAVKVSGRSGNWSLMTECPSGNLFLANMPEADSFKIMSDQPKDVSDLRGQSLVTRTVDGELFIASGIIRQGQAPVAVIEVAAPAFRASKKEAEAALKIACTQAEGILTTSFGIGLSSSIEIERESGKISRIDNSKNLTVSV